MGIPLHPRTRALIEGRTGLDGYDLQITHNFVNAGERHYRFAQGEFDVGEFSTATLLRTKEKGFRFRALPVFFERGPRQRNIFYREGNLNDPRELKDKKVGCFRYGATAVVWARGFLLDEYGLKTTDMNWYVSGQEVYIGRELPVKVERLNPPAPFGEEKSQLARLVGEGTLHAAIVAGDSGYTGVFGGGKLPKIMSEVAGVKPLFDDTDEIVRYVRRTRIYPIIHIIVLKEEIAGLPAKLIDVFREAKRLATDYLSADELAGYEKEKTVLEEDPYAYVLGATEKTTLKALARYQIEQGLLKESIPLEDLFVEDAFA